VLTLLTLVNPQDLTHNPLVVGSNPPGPSCSSKLSARPDVENAWRICARLLPQLGGELPPPPEGW